MACDDKTSYLSLPLPHPRNTLREDCPRIKESLQTLDSHARTVDSSLNTLKKQAATASGALTELQRTSTALEKQLAEEETRREATDATVSHTQSALAAHQKELTALDNGFERLASAKADQTAVSALEVQVHNVQVALEEKNAEIESQILKLGKNSPPRLRQAVLHGREKDGYPAYLVGQEFVNMEHEDGVYHSRGRRWCGIVAVKNGQCKREVPHGLGCGRSGGHHLGAGGGGEGI